GRVETVGAFEDLLVPLDVGPEQPGRVAAVAVGVVRVGAPLGVGRGGGGGAVVVGRPPHLAGAGPGGGRGQVEAVRVVQSGAGVATAVAREGAQGVVIIVDRQSDLVQVVRALDPRRRRADLLDRGQQ